MDRQSASAPGSEDFQARLAAARAGGGRVSPLDVWVSTPRPSPVMVWTPAQTRVFLAYARRHRLHALYHLIANRGLRRGEACGLRRADTDLAAAVTTVRWQITQLGWSRPGPRRSQTQASGRSPSTPRPSRRSAPTGSEQDKERKLPGMPGPSPGSSSPPRRQPAAPGRRHRQVRAARLPRRAPPIRLHDLRHGAATLLLAAGHDMKVVQETLGLSSITIAADTYTSVLPQLARKSAEDVAALIRPAGQAPPAPGQRRRASDPPRKARGKPAPKSRPARK